MSIYEKYRSIENLYKASQREILSIIHEGGDQKALLHAIEIRDNCISQLMQYDPHYHGVIY